MAGVGGSRSRVNCGGFRRAADSSVVLAAFAAANELGMTNSFSLQLFVDHLLFNISGSLCLWLWKSLENNWRDDLDLD
jgi:hypothetical protein